ncbi:MAG: hypothetical protein ACXAB7_14635 [Candidatus Kariarchaeaceae archaeon]|jgi:hypothetical protein
MTEDMPIKLDKISNWLLPRKFYVRIKEYHPVLGAVFMFLWTGFWTVLAILLNVLLLLVIVLTIALILAAIFGDDSFDPVFLDLSFGSKKDERERRY